MADMKIDDATQDSAVSGAEVLPISDAGAPKSVSIEQITNFVLEGLSDVDEASATDISADGVYIAQGGVVKRLPELILARAMMDYAFALTGIVTPNGNEIFVVDDSGTKKTMTLEKLTAYVTANYADIFTSLGNADPMAASDGIVVKQGNSVKKGTLGALAVFVQSTLASYFASCVNVLTVQDSDKIVVMSGGVTKTMLVSQFMAALSAVQASVPGTTTVGNVPVWATATGGLGNGLAVQTTVRAQGTASNDALPTEAAVRAAVDAEAAARATAIANAVNDVGDVKAPLTTTADKVPQWDSTAKKLKDGLAVATTIGSTASDAKLPTEKAVKDAITSEASARTAAIAAAVDSEVSARTAAIAAAVDSEVSARTTAIAAAIASETSARTTAIAAAVDSEASARTAAITAAVDSEASARTAADEALGARIDDLDALTGPESTTEGKIPQWDSTNRKLADGLTLQQSVRNSANASHSALATEKAVRDAVDAKISPPASHNEDKIPTWGAANELKAGKSIVNVIANNASNDNIPTEKAVRDALPVAATSEKAGLITAADKVKLDGLADTGAVEEIGQNLSDNDTVVVKKGDSVYRKSLLSRFWTYILGKLPTVRIDLFAAAQDNTNANATTGAHGLLPKLDGNTAHFLRGDGAWGEPPGSADFVGDSGSGGTHGLVPAPASGDAAANKFLNASGAWTVAPSAAGVDIPGSTAIDALTGSDAFYVYDASEGAYRRVSGAHLAAFLNGLTRYETLFVPAGAFAPSTVGGAAMSSLRFTNNTHDVAAFPADEDAFVEFNVQMPDDWNGLPFKAKVQWTCNSADAENDQTAVFTLGAVAFDDGDAITDAPTTPVSISDALLAANELHVSAASAAITPDGEGKFIHFRLGRDVSEGTITQPVQVLGVTIQYGRTSDAEQW